MSSAATVEEVTNYISDIKISKDKLTSGNIEAILNTLVYDGKVEVIHQSNGTKCYRYVTSLNFVNGITRVPCGICPVIDQCVIGGAVSPSTCIYMSDWINF
jgi:DNA-directed RNA polymerase III subunit RPC6